MDRIRRIVQVVFTALSNGYLIGFKNGKIYSGFTKNMCLPGLNCYSCPGALGSCPIGSLQAVLGSNNYKISFYVLGFLMFIGSLIGRGVCGWLCPFGLLQDLLYKIPFFIKRKSLPGSRYLIYLKYIILIVFVIILPLTVLDVIGQGSPWFCKYICPSGTFMAGIPLVAMNIGMRGAVGVLFWWKVTLLVIIIIMSIIVYRPFCKYLCPLGAIYGFFNKISFLRIKVDKDKCTTCGECVNACKMDVDILNNTTSMECIKCGDCIGRCKKGALKIR